MSGKSQLHRTACPTVQTGPVQSTPAAHIIFCSSSAPQPRVRLFTLHSMSAGSGRLLDNQIPTRRWMDVGAPAGSRPLIDSIPHQSEKLLALQIECGGGGGRRREAGGHSSFRMTLLDGRRPGSPGVTRRPRAYSDADHLPPPTSSDRGPSPRAATRPNPDGLPDPPGPAQPGGNRTCVDQSV